MPSSHSSMIEERSHFFLFPQSGVPDPAGNWICVKAAIGTKENALYRLVHDKELKMPLRSKGEDGAVMPLYFKGSLLVVPLLKPVSLDPNSPPEFFSVFAKHTPPRDLASKHNLPQIPEDSDWVRFPMDTYERMAPAAAAQHRRNGSAEFRMEYGTAAKAELWKPEEEDEELMRAGEEKGRKVYVETSREMAEEGDSWPTIVLGSDPK